MSRIELYPQRNARIVRLTMEGASREAIAYGVGASLSAIGHVRDRAGVTQRNASSDVRARAVALYHQSGAVRAAETVRFSVFSVRRWVRQARESARVS